MCCCFPPRPKGATFGQARLTRLEVCAGNSFSPLLFMGRFRAYRFHSFTMPASAATPFRSYQCWYLKPRIYLSSDWRSKKLPVQQWAWAHQRFMRETHDVACNLGCWEVIRLWRIPRNSSSTLGLEIPPYIGSYVENGCRLNQISSRNSPTFFRPHRQGSAAKLLIHNDWSNKWSVWQVSGGHGLSPQLA